MRTLFSSMAAGAGGRGRRRRGGPAARRPGRPAHPGAGLLQDRRLPALVDPQRHRRDPAARRGQRVHRRPPPRTPTSSPPPTSRSTRRSSGSPPPATCSTPPSRRRSSPTSRPAAGTSASTPRPTPSTTGPGTAGSSAPTSPRTRPTRRRRSGSRTAATSPPRTCRRPGRGSTSGTTTGPTRGPTSRCWPAWTSRRTRGGIDGRRPPDHLVPELRRRPVLVHRARATPRSRTPTPNFTRMLLGGIQIAAGNRPADCRPETGYTALFDGTQASLNQWRQAGPGRLHAGQRHADLVRRHGPAVVPGADLQQLLAQGRLDDAGRRQRRRLHRLPRPAGDPWNPVNQGHEIQIDATDADPSPHHRQRLQLPGPELRRRATPRSTRRARGTPTRSACTASGSRSGSTASRSTTTRAPATSPTATSACRTTAPAPTSTTATSGSRPTAAAAGHRRRPGQAGHRVQRGAGQRARRRQRRRRQRRPPAGAAPTPTRSGSPWTSAQPYDLNRVRLNWETAYGRAYQIQISPNNATWTTVYSTTTGDGGVDDLTVTGTGRYVRVNGTQRATQWGYSLWDFNVYGTPGGGTGAHPAVAQPAGRPCPAWRPGSAHVGRQRGRRQHRHPLGQRLQRPAVDLGRPRLRPHGQPGPAAVGGGVRPGVPDPDLDRQRDLDQRLLHHDR